jgi:hypothetical protein
VAYALFDTPAIHGIPGTKELTQAGGEMVPPLVIATAQLLQVLDDSSVNIALPSIQDELAVPTPPVFTGLPPDPIPPDPIPADGITPEETLNTLLHGAGAASTQAYPPGPKGGLVVKTLKGTHFRCPRTPA